MYCTLNSFKGLSERSPKYFLFCNDYIYVLYLGALQSVIFAKIFEEENVVTTRMKKTFPLLQL